MVEKEIILPQNITNSKFLRTFLAFFQGLSAEKSGFKNQENHVFETLYAYNFCMCHIMISFDVKISYEKKEGSKNKRITSFG